MLRTSFAPCPHCSYNKQTQMYFTLVPKNILIAVQKSFIRKRNSQLTVRDLFCFYAHNSVFLILLVSAVSDIYEAYIKKLPGTKPASFAYSLMPNALGFCILFQDLRAHPAAICGAFPSSPQFSIILPSKQQLL